MIPINMKDFTKRQHYIPEAYLQFFANTEKNTKKVYAYFCDKKELKYVSIENVCCQSLLYEEIAINVDENRKIYIAPNKIEKSFVQLEREYASIVRRILKDFREEMFLRITDSDAETLKEFMSSLVSRSPILVHIANCVTKMVYGKNQPMLNEIKEKVPGVPENVILSVLAHNLIELCLSPRKGIISLGIKQTMDDSQICLIHANKAKFITSSRPVVNIYGEANGTHFDLLGMPISQQLFLAFINTEAEVPSMMTIEEESVKRINSKQLRGKDLILISQNIDSLININYPEEIKEECEIFEMPGYDKEEFSNLYHEIMNADRIKYWKE